MAPRDFDSQISDALSLDQNTLSYTKTGTGLDYLVEQILKDPGLNNRVSDADIQAGARAAAGMNAIIVEAIRATGVANDGSFKAADMHIVANWIFSNRFDAFKTLHGDDERNIETGYHLVQGDGGTLQIFGDKLVDQVGDSIYHLGFRTKGNRLSNEDGDLNARAEKVAYWLNELMADDLASGSLANTSVNPMVTGTTGTGLDEFVDAITSDPGLDRSIPATEINDGAKAADAMNKIIVEGIKTLGLADDSQLSTSEVYDLADWINSNRLAEWKAAHGDDEKGVETGFHLVQGDGAEGRLFGRSEINSVADSIYHLGFGYKNRSLINEDGNQNESVEKVTHWLQEVLADDLQNGSLATGRSAPPVGTTGTGLDRLTDLILMDAELNRKIPLSEIETGARAADTMNAIIVDGVKALGIANNGRFSVGDMRDLADWIEANRKADWIKAHGDDEKNTETGFHLVQGDGAVTRAFGSNAINTVADGIYHLGFGYKKSHLVNEDGNTNASLAEVSHWLNELLAGDLASGALTNSGVDPYPTGTTGTALDQVVDLLTTDPGLARYFKSSEIAQVARDADGLNKILIDGIKSTGVANDGNINELDIRVIGDWIKDNALGRWSGLRGDDDTDTGLMGLMWMGAVNKVAGVNIVNQFASMVYSLGYEQKYGGVIDEDGDWKGRAEDAAAWLNTILASELGDGSLSNSAQVSAPASAIASHVVLDAATVSVTDDDNYNVYADSSALRLTEGTIAFTFVAEDPSIKKLQTLFSKDAAGTNNGDTRVYFYEGKLYAKISYRGEDKYVEIPQSVKAGEAHDFAMTFSDKGLSFWLDGVQVEYRSDISLTWVQNAKDVVVGASNGSQSAKDPNKIVNEFQGEITGFKIYNRALDRGEIEGLSAGLTVTGDGNDNDLVGSDGQDALHGGLGRDVLVSGDGDDVVNGGYGADFLKGGKGDDFLDGGHGQDKLEGGEGDDILLSTSDGREQTPGQLLPGYSKPKKIRPDNGDLDPASQKLYPNQPIAADDVMTGGAGADTFRFQFMINAKFDIIMKHARKDGSINWRGVAGENTYVHDHWVDMIGDDVITDFNRSEGDRIEIAGHTLTIENLTYHDSNNDGVNDYSKISFISKQGNGGGAHDEDALGSVTVYGDLVQMSDITQIPSNTVFYGIVENISDIDEAITPLSVDNGTARNDPGLNAASATGPRGQADTTGATAATGNNVVAATRSGTGLDQILDWIENDAGLQNRISDAEISEGSQAAAAMNAIVIEAIKATGAANDGKIDAGDVYDLSDWIQANRSDAWLRFHGDDERSSETAFHKVQNDGAVEIQYGRNSVNTVADAIYHLGFGYKNGRLINEDGDANERVESVAYWLDELLKDDLTAGTLVNNAAASEPAGTTGTGLDQLVQIIMDDRELNRVLPNFEQEAGAAAADTMNHIVVESIKALGLANDGTFTASDVMALADYIKANHRQAWSAAHGDDEKNVETGFHLVQGDGAASRLYGENAVNTVADGIYHLGFGYKWDRLINEDGDGNARVETVAYWLNQLLVDDMQVLANPNVDPTPGGHSNTGLDQLVTAIEQDEGLQRSISLEDIQAGADAARVMNDMIIQSIKATGVANNGQFTVGDVMVISDYIQDYRKAWTAAHGDDAKNVETGFHLVQGDGGSTRLFGHSAVNTVADGLYHLGFGYKNGRLINEDGDGNASLSDVAGWLNELLADDLASGALSNSAVSAHVSGDSGTGLDALVDMVTADVGLAGKLKTTEIADAAAAANSLNKILIEGIKATGIANDGQISKLDIVDLDAWVGSNHAGKLKAFNKAFNPAEIWSATSPIYGHDGINEVAHAIYSIGFGTKWGNSLLNENGKWAATLEDTAAWLSGLLAQDLNDGVLFSDANAYTDPSALTGSAVVALAQDVTADGSGGYENIDHFGGLRLSEGTISFDFTANQIQSDKNMVLFTKDARNEGSGHTQIYINGENLYVRLQTNADSYYFKAELSSPLNAGTNYHLAMIFGAQGLKLYIDGEKVISQPDMKIDWRGNAEDIVLGGSGDWRNDKYPDHVHSVLDGTISNAAIYNRALTEGEIDGLHGVNTDVVPSATTPTQPVDPTPVDPTPPAPPVIPTPPADNGNDPSDPGTDDRIVGDAAANTLDGGAGNDLVNGRGGNDDLSGGADNDRLLGGDGNDTLDGGTGNDTLYGDADNDSLSAGDGSDRLEGGSGSDTMTGGAGADIYVVDHNKALSGDTDLITDLDFAEDVLIIRAFGGNSQVIVNSTNELYGLNYTGLTVSNSGTDTRLIFDEAGISHEVVLNGIGDPSMG